MRSMYLFVDNVRTCPNVDLTKFVPITCRSYDTAITAIEEMQGMKMPFVIDLDHDLGESKSGYDICKFLIEHPDYCEGFSIHSMNPVGCNNIRQLMTHYGFVEMI